MLKVKIVNVSSSVAWYRNDMGKTFEVNEDQGKYYLTPPAPGIARKMILKKDCIIIKQ